MNSHQWKLFARFMAAVIWLLAKDSRDLTRFDLLRQDLNDEDK